MQASKQILGSAQHSAAAQNNAELEALCNASKTDEEKH